MLEEKRGRWSLSGAQLGIWFAQQLDPDNPIFNTAECIEIRGPVDQTLFETAVRQAVGEAEALHVRFGEDADGPWQYIVPSPEWQLQVIDVSGQDDPVHAAQCWMEHDLAQVVDLSRGPLFTEALLKLASDRYYWYQRIHHIVIDGFGVSLLLKKVAQVYTALAGGGYSEPAAFGPFRTILEEDTAYRMSQQVEADRQFWLKRFVDEPEVVSLGGHAQRSARSFLRRSAQLPESALHCWQSTAQATGTSWPDVVAAAAALYVHRITGANEVVLGLPVMCRLGSASIRVPGMMMNLLPLRVTVRPDMSLMELLQQVAAEIRDIKRHQRYRHQDIRRDLKLLADNRRLFGPMVNVMPFVEELNFGGYGGSVRNLGSGPVDDLSLNVYGSMDGNGLRMDMDANPSIYSEEELESHLHRYLYLLDSLADAEPADPVGGLSIILPDERDRVLLEWNDTARPLPRLSVPELFEMQAARTPKAEAVVCEALTLRYEELNRDANRLAHMLIARGVGPDRIVALSLPRSLDMVVAILAVHKAGAAYLPIDPDYPSERIAYMLEDAEPMCLITAQELAEDFGKMITTEAIVELDAPATLHDLERQAVHNPGDDDRMSSLLPLHPSYVIYTSGSTGRPKGVMLTFEGLANLLLDMQDRIEIGEQDRLLSVTTISFDISVMEVLLPLTCGSTLDIVMRDTILDAPALIRRIHETGATIMQATPTLWQSIVACRPGKFKGLKVITGGEALPVGLKLALQELNCEVNNQYGPTETTIYSTAAKLDHEREKPSIGGAIWNTRLYVLDTSLSPAPPGVAGELYIAGSGLGRGYLGRPDLTAERFVADPFGPPGSRMYRTGDLARWLPNGWIDYLGRADHQIKLRGFRIETGEIESVLVTHPDVEQAAVIVREDRAGDRRLVAYIVPALSASSGLIDTAELRRYASLKLAEYMVPSVIVRLETMPLTPNKKVDRKALPVPNHHAAIGRMPRTPQEEMLCRIFAEVLGLPRVTIDDDFFALGGHSLLAGRVMVRVREAFGVELSIGSLFEASTAASLVKRLDHAQEARHAVRPAERSERLPLSFAQQRLWFLYRLEGPSPTYNIPLVARLSGTLDLDALQSALGDVAARHESLRTIYPDDLGASYQFILAVEEARPELIVSEINEADLPERLAEAVRYRFKLASETSLRVELFKLGDDEYVLLLLLHHIAGDGWSLTPLTRDLSHAYAARCQRSTPGLPPLPVQYADYAIWQEELLGSSGDESSLINRQLDYWRSALRGLPEQLDLPTDYPRPAVASYQGGSVSFPISRELHQQLNALGQSNRATLFMIFQSAMAALFTNLGAGTDIPIGSPVSGRNDDNLDNLIGFFINTLVFRVDTSDDPSFTELLQRVREMSLAAFEHQDVPFERLVEALNPPRSRARHPLFQVMLVLQNTPEASLDLPGITSSLQLQSVGTAKFDLTFELTERRDANGEPDGLDGWIEFSTDLFKHSSVEAMAERFVRVLESAVIEPSKTISKLDILTGQEREEMRQQWSTPLPVSKQATIPQQFEAQVGRSPLSTAIVCDGESLSYEELNERANQLAHMLIASGVGTEQIVALALPRSIEMVVGILAALKAGAAYLPLDPEYPADRLAYMMEHASPVCLLASVQVMDQLPNSASVQRIVIDEPEQALRLQRYSKQNPSDLERHRPLMPQSAAYIIYTSGSTGKPKGVLVPHQNVIRLFTSTEHWFHFDETDVWTLFHSYAFDFSVWEIWGPLLYGGRLVVVPHTISRSPDEMLSLLSQEGVTVLNQTPSAFYQLIQADREQPETGRNLALRYVVFGGEALELGRLDDWYQLHADDAPRLVNMYGITETTVHVSYLELNRYSAMPGASSLIGESIPDLRVYVLDSKLQPVPYGVTGEMYVAGAGLARGYWGRPDLTADRFVADPYGPPGTRMYRTGDLAKRFADGTLDYLGRSDHQVKIRGFRIELGEIESVLIRHADVAQVAVIVREDQPGDKRLVAYVVSHSNETSSGAELRRYAASLLPDYMVPWAILFMDKLPLTPNGKLDRKGLPAPDITSDADGRNPRTPQEEVLCELFAEILGAKRVGIDDSFFELGGHSLLAVRLISRVREALGKELSIAALFEAPTVAGLVDKLEMGGGNSALQVVLPLRTHGNQIPLFCVHPAGGLSWCYAGLMKHLGMNYPIYGLQARGIAQAEELPQSLEEMTADYIRHIRSIQPTGPYRLLGWSLGGNVAQSIAVQLQEAGEDIELLAILDAYPSHYLPIKDDPDEDEALTALLALGGFDRESIEEGLGDTPLTIATALELLRNESSALASLEEETMMNLKTTYENSVQLLKAYVPKRFEGDMLFFHSTIIPDWFDPIDPEMWNPYVGGVIERHDIECRHKDLCQPGPLDYIGKCILGKLEAAADQKQTTDDGRELIYDKSF
ncbi:amino acid adenylation domain-containing protein [Paenibacillus glucanolyticus]|uniref:amino acid adenylation domain-containing protein n=1 Tax=Paenibacillus glucanolyticus TaxID=59843 RepID=UPI00096F8635|nr:non-ribosomal peptide synthetase [Paenibacillus glucanolyticus]OMF80932.1 non-ribosomal peptide synthetase [Paenibacillus glucanolyticus]